MKIVQPGGVLLYEGQVDEHFLFHGQGKEMWPYGDVYEGHYHHGQRHGEGIYRFGFGGPVWEMKDGKRAQ